jgi:hypothetical protein
MDPYPISFVAAMYSTRQWWGINKSDKKKRTDIGNTLVEIFKRRHKFRFATLK